MATEVFPEDEWTQEKVARLMDLRANARFVPQLQALRQRELREAYLRGELSDDLPQVPDGGPEFDPA